MAWYQTNIGSSEGTLEPSISEIALVNYQNLAVTSDGTTISYSGNSYTGANIKCVYASLKYTVSAVQAGTYRVIGIYYGTGIKTELVTVSAGDEICIVKSPVAASSPPVANTYYGAIVYRVS